jgi:hypothetical protein
MVVASTSAMAQSRDSNSGMAKPVAESNRTEVPELRTAYSRTFRTDAGTMIAEISLRPEAYEQGGRYVPVDTAIVPGEGEFAFVNSSNSIKTSFGASNATIQVEADGGTFTFSPQALVMVSGGSEQVMASASAVSPTLDGSNVVYTNIFPGVDAIYTIGAGLVKGHYVFNSRVSGVSATHIGVREAISGGTLAAGEGGSMILSAGKAKLTLPRPYVTENTEGVESFDPENPPMIMGDFQIGTEGETSTLTTLIDYEWFGSSRRVYPLSIDPTFMDQMVDVTGKGTEVFHVLTSDFGNRSTWWKIMTSWGSSGDLEDAGIVEFDLSSIPASSTIVSANLELYNLGSSADPREIGVFRNTSAWNEATVTWNSRPTTEASPTDSWPAAVAPPGGFVSFDVAADVQAFVDASAANNGWTITEFGPPAPNFNSSWNLASEDPAPPPYQPKPALSNPKITVEYSEGGGSSAPAASTTSLIITSILVLAAMLVVIGKRSV